MRTWYFPAPFPRKSRGLMRDLLYGYLALYLPLGFSLQAGTVRDRRLLVVSGSNMSGKSTLLRAIGVNAVLAAASPKARAPHSGFH